MIRRILTAVTGPVISILLALLVTTLFLTFGGYSAGSAYQVMWEYGTKPASLVSSLNNAVPLYLAACRRYETSMPALTGQRYRP